MLKSRRIQWRAFALAAPLLIVAFLLSGGAEALTGGTISAVRAAGTAAKTMSGDCTDAHRGPSFGGTLVISADEVVCHELTIFGGTLTINGEVKGDIVAFGSTVNVAGAVEGDIELYGSTIALLSGSQVRGDIQLYGGKWTKSPGAQLEGRVFDHSKHGDWFFASIGRFSFPLLSILTWVALGILLTSLLPEHVMLVRATVVSTTRRSLGIGLLSALLTPPVLVVLVALILSIPLAIIVAIGLVAAWALGTVAIGWLVGEYILRTFAPHRNTRTMQVVVGLTVLVLAGSLPYIGWLVTVGAGLLGLGAVFLSRFGTRLYSQPKHPLTL
jgi:cytoskeletal protein CcmA (bactofilin family)